MKVNLNLSVVKPPITITYETKIPLDPLNFIRLDGQNQIPTLWVDNDVATSNPMEYGVTPVASADRIMLYDFRDLDNVVVSKIRIYDGHGTMGDTPMIVYGITEFNEWIQLMVFDGALFNSWREYTVTPIKVKFLAFTTEFAGMGDRSREIEVYGEYETKDPSVLPPSTFPVKPVPFRQICGTNGYPWSLLMPSRGTPPQWKIDVAKQYGVFRVYHDWRYLEGSRGVYSFQASESGGWLMDTFYETCKANGIIAIPSLQGIPQWLADTWTPPNLDARQHDGTMEATDIWAYADNARALFNMAARYGNGDGFNVLGTITDIAQLPESANENDTYLLNITVDDGAQTVVSRAYTWKSGEWLELLSVDRVQKWDGEPMNNIKIGTNLLDYIEVGNENNKTWHGRNGMQLGAEHAAQLSAVYDGHMGTMGPGIGIKHASSNIKVTTSGLAGIHYNFFMGIIYWSMRHRGFNPDGTVNVPFDVVNFHSYRNTQGSEQHQGSGRKGMAPEPSGYYESAIRLRELIWRYLKPETELILGETGYDIHPDSVQAPIPFGDYNTEDLQGIFILRTMFESARFGVDFLTPYEVIDNSTGGGSSALYASCGMNNRDVEPWTPRVISRLIVQYRKIIDDYVYDGEVSVSPVRCIRYKNGNDYAYIMYLPIEEASSVEYVLSDLPTHSYALLHNSALHNYLDTWKTPIVQNSSYTITVTEVPVMLQISPVEIPVITLPAPVPTEENYEIPQGTAKLLDFVNIPEGAVVEWRVGSSTAPLAAIQDDFLITEQMSEETGTWSLFTRFVKEGFTSAFTEIVVSIVGEGSEPELVSIAIDPDNVLELEVNGAQQYSVVGTYDDASTAPIIGGFWESSNTDVATVDSTGLVTALTEGNTTISVTYEGLSDSIEIEIVAETNYLWNTLELSEPTVISQSGMAAEGYWPDGKLSIVQNESNNDFVTYWAERSNYRTVGSSPYPETTKGQVISANNVFGQGKTTIPGFTDNGTWFIGVHRLPTKLVGFFHAESTWSGGGIEAYKTIGVAYSEDEGLIWTTGEKILAPNYPKPTEPTWSGIGDGVVVYNEALGAFICYYSALVSSINDFAICMAISYDSEGAPGTWYKWDGTDFTGLGYDDATDMGGVDVGIRFLLPRSGANPSVVWNTLLERWVMVYAGWDNRIYTSSSIDGLSWEWPVAITETGEDCRYPNLISEQGDKVAGKKLRLYYGGAQQPDGTRQFTYRELEYTPALPDPELPEPITSETEYTFVVGQTEPGVLAVTNLPVGATAQWQAGNAPPLGVNLGEGASVEINPAFFGAATTVNGYVRFLKDGYSTPFKQFLIHVVEAAPELVSIEIDPDTFSDLEVGATQQLIATGIYDNASEVPLTNEGTWSSSNNSIATVSSSGLVTGVGAGEVTITYSVGEIEGYAIGNIVEPEPPEGRVFTVGTGSGNLTIDGAVLGGGILANDVIEIASGSYGMITYQNFSIFNGRATIKPAVSGEVFANYIRPRTSVGVDLEDIEFTGAGNSTQLELDGNYMPFRNITFRNIRHLGNSSAFTVRHINPVIYDPLDEENTVITNLTFEDCDYNNTGQFNLGGVDIENTGLIRNLVLRNNYWHNRNGGYDWGDGEGSDGSGVMPNNVVDLTNVENYLIEGNRFYKMLRTDNHTAMIYARGWGIFRNNYAEKYRGQLGRLWIFAKEAGRKTLAYNNIGRDCPYYSLIEFQSNASMIAADNFVPSDAYCLFNTAMNFGEWNDPAYWQCVILDNYGIGGGNVHFANNVGINVSPGSAGASAGKLVWGNTNLVTETNNQIFANQQLAKFNSDLAPYSDSSVVGAGVQLSGNEVLVDFNNETRTSPPTIGAIEALDQSSTDDMPAPILQQPVYYTPVGEDLTIELDGVPEGAQLQASIDGVTWFNRNNPTTLDAAIFFTEPGVIHVTWRYLVDSIPSNVSEVMEINIIDELPAPIFDQESYTFPINTDITFGFTNLLPGVTLEGAINSFDFVPASNPVTLPGGAPSPMVITANARYVLGSLISEVTTMQITITE